MLDNAPSVSFKRSAGSYAVVYNVFQSSVFPQSVLHFLNGSKFLYVANSLV